jgi:hypothetical protein
MFVMSGLTKARMLPSLTVMDASHTTQLYPLGNDGAVDVPVAFRRKVSSYTTHTCCGQPDAA